MATVRLRHFMVDSTFSETADDIYSHFYFQSEYDIDIDLALLLEANTMAERDIDHEQRFQVLQHEQRIVLSYLHQAGPRDHLRLDNKNFAATAGHIKRFVCESVGLGMLTAAVQEYFAWTLGPDSIANFDILPGHLKNTFAKKGVRPDLLFDFKDGARMLAGEARGRSKIGPQGNETWREQHKRMREIIQWSADHGAYPVTMTWTYLGGSGVQVDLFTVSDRSLGAFDYVPPAIEYAARRQITEESIERSEQRAASLFNSAPSIRRHKPRTLFGREVRGSWVTADLVHPSRVRLFLGAMEQPLGESELRAARSRLRRRTSQRTESLEAALNDRLVLIVAQSDDPEPDWRRVETLIERGELQ